MHRTMDKNQALGVMGALSAALLFGFSFLAVKVAVTQASVLTVLGWRFFLAFIAMSLCAALGIFKLRFRGKSLWPLVVMALCQPILYFVLETLGIQMTTASESGTIMACIPLVTLLLMPVLAHEQPTRRQWASIGISVAGVILVGVTKGMQASFSFSGYLLLILATVSDAAFLNLSRRAAGFTGVEKSYVMAGMGALAFTAAALVEHGRAGTLGAFLQLPLRNRAFLLSILYLSVGCSVLAFILRNVGVARLGPGRTGSFAGITTLVSVFAGVLLLGEPFSPLQGVGTLLVLAGIYGANMVPRSARAVTALPAGEAPPAVGEVAPTDGGPGGAG